MSTRHALDHGLSLDQQLESYHTYAADLIGVYDDPKIIAIKAAKLVEHELEFAAKLRRDNLLYFVTESIGAFRRRYFKRRAESGGVDYQIHGAPLIVRWEAQYTREDPVSVDIPNGLTDVQFMITEYINTDTQLAIEQAIRAEFWGDISNTPSAVIYFDSLEDTDTLPGNRFEITLNHSFAKVVAAA